MPLLTAAPSNKDVLWTITILFLERYSGRYPSHAVLRAHLNAFLDNEYPEDLSWMDRERDTVTLLDMIVKIGGVSVAEPRATMKGASAGELE